MKINKDFLTQAGIFIAFLVGFWIISVFFLLPATQGKVLQQGDMQQVRLMRDAAEKYYEQTGQFPNWNDRVFSGMPGNLITGIPSGSVILKSRPMELFGLIKSPYNFLFIAMMSMFILLLSARVNRWLSAAGAIGYAFMTFTISSYEGGHITKVLAMDVMPGVIAGLVLISRRKYLLGAGILGLYFSMLVGYFHYQIAYYAGIMAGIYMLVELVFALKARENKHALISVGLSVLMLGVGAASNIGKALDTAYYGESTMRGGSAVNSESPKGGPQGKKARKGLDIDYAFSWSYGIDESFTLLIPRYKGGSSQETVPENDLGAEKLPTYFGDMPFTGGPVYMGAILIFLFVLGVVTVLRLLKLPEVDSSTKNQARLFLIFSLLCLAVSLILSWGKNFGINTWFFDNLPYYNKFRTPMMALVIAQLIIPFFGIYGLNLLFSERFNNVERSAAFRKGVIAIGAVVLLALIGIATADFALKTDAETARKMGAKESEQISQVVKTLRDSRSSLVWSDFTRTLLFIGAAGALIWFGIKGHIQKNVLWLGIMALIFVDLFTVARRYLTDENWQEKEEELAIQPTPLELKLQKANKENDRIFDLRYDPFNNNNPAPFFRNVGGYHPAKMSRYQDIISFGITPNGGQLNGDWVMNNKTLDMLNCRYVLDNQNGKEDVFIRPTALGHAWFVKSVKTAADAKSALMSLSNLDVRNEAVVEATDKQKPAKSAYAVDSTSVINQSYYSFDTIRYESIANAEGLGVFSEVYYNEKNGGWKAYIDGKETPVLRVNYILRGLDIPAGKHKIMFVYEPSSRAKWINIETLTSYSLLLLALAALVLMALQKENGENMPEKAA
jgi:hypothetical protein